MDTATIIAILVAIVLIALVAGVLVQRRRRRGRVMAGQIQTKRR